MYTSKLINGLIVFGLCLSAWLAGSPTPTQAAGPQTQAPQVASTSAGNITWIEKAPMPVAVSSFGYAVLGEKIYVIGGGTSGGSDTTTVQRYTPSTNSWEVDTGHGGTLAPLPQPRSFGFFCEVIGGKIHCMGGWQNGTYKGDHFIYDPIGNTWTTGPALPNYPIGQFATAVNNKIYVFGGWWGSYQTSVYEYSEATGWSTKAPMPTPRNHGTAAVYNGKIYAIGGEGGQPAQQQPLDVVEMYDPISNTWTSGLAHLPSPQRFIGWSGAPTVDGLITMAVVTATYAYDPATNAWQTLDALPVAIDGGGGTVTIDGRLYAIGTHHTVQGIPPSRQPTIDWLEQTPMPVTVTSFAYAATSDMLHIYIIGGDLAGSSTTTVQRYTPATDTWEVDTNHSGTLAPLPQPRSFYMDCGMISGRIHCVGGWQNGIYRGEHFIYDPISNTWSTGPSIPQYPIGQFAATVNNKLYVFGGWWGTFQNSVFEYSETGGWTSKHAMPTARNHGTAAVYGGKIYVIGGESGPSAQQYGPLDVVEAYDPQSDTWTTGLAHMPVPMGYLGSSGAPVSAGMIYLLGPGATAYGYDPLTNAWRTYNSMPGSAWGVTAVNGAIYAISPEHTYQGVTVPWAGFHHDAQHTGRSPYVGPQRNTLAWTYPISGAVNSSPAIGSDGTIYIGAENNKLYAVAPDGSLRWAYPTGGGIYSSPAIGHDGTIYVGSRDHKLYAIRPDGSLGWTYTTGGEVNSSPAIGHDGTIYVGSYDGQLYAINPAGTLKCAYTAGAVVHSSPTIGPDGIIYFGSANGRMNALYPNCALKWSQPVTGNGVWTHAALSSDGSTLYYGADDGYLYATDTITGGLKWKSPWTYGGVQSSPAIGRDGTIYVGTQYGNLWALNPADGSLRWNTYMTLSAWSSPAIGADGTIYFAADYGTLFAMNPDGSVKWTHSGNGHFRSSPAIGKNGALYIGSTDGQLYAFKGEPSTCGPDIGSWTAGPALPKPMGTPFDGSGQPLVFYNDRVYVFGGRNDAGLLADVYYSTIDANGSLGPWIATTSLPDLFFDQAVVRVGRHVYLITGANGSIAVYYAPFNADGSLGAWIRTADLLPSRQDFAAAAYGEYIYVVAGNASGLSKLVKFTSVKPDGSLNPWADTTQLPVAIQGHTLVARDGFLYVFAPDSTTYYAPIHVDGTVGDWATTTSLPQAMSNYTTFEHTDHVYLLGGSSPAVSYAPILTNSALGQWQATTSLSVQRSRMRAGGNQCVVYAIGGYDGSHYRDTVYYARLQSCEPVTSVQLSRTPDGDLFAGNLVRFTANANGTTPLTYTWRLNGAAVGENRSTFEQTFTSAGAYTIGVTVANAYGQGNAAMSVQVLLPAQQQPDLSRSYQSVNMRYVGQGDVLTYTLFLRNASPMTATAILTDAVPAHTAYLTNSASASSGVVSMSNESLLWSGQIVSGTPIIVQFAARVLTATVGAPITNVAQLDDGLGNILSLKAGSIVNPGFGLTINRGELFTNVPTVTLGLTWSATNPPIAEMFISNDGGFSSGTGWLPVTPTLTNWTLATYGNLVMPRTVYVKFRAGDGQPYGPLQDEIIYDPTPPQVTGIEIIPQPAHRLEVSGAQTVIVRISWGDDNSGVSRMQISSNENFGPFAEFTATGSTIDIPWTLPASGAVYVRVMDRAGNLSPIARGHGVYKVYLPMIVR